MVELQYTAYLKKTVHLSPNVTMLCSANGTAVVSVVCLSVVCDDRQTDDRHMGHRGTCLRPLHIFAMLCFAL